MTLNDDVGISEAGETSIGRGSEGVDGVGIKGFAIAELFGPDGELKGRWETHNLVTQVGDQMYAENGGGIGSPPATPTGMRLGSGTTAVAKTGAGAAIVTYITGSASGFESGYPASSLNGSARRISYRAAWAAGVATDSAIAEVVTTNESGPTDVAGTAANTISRFLFASTIDKGAADTLTVTLHHDLEGA